MAGARVRWDVPVEDRLCLALYATSRAMTARYRPILDPLNLTYPQYMVMSVLWEHEVVGIGSLAQMLSLDASTLTPLLKRLEALGLLSRDRQVHDERKVIISLTTRGSELRQEAASVSQQICGATGLSPEAYKTLVEQIERLRQVLNEG